MLNYNGYYFSLNKMVSDFFYQIIDFYYIRNQFDKLIIVTHLVPGIDQFLLAVHQKIPIAGIIPKASSINHLVANKIEHFIPILRYTRQQIKSQPEVFLKELKNYVGDSKFAVIDTGGYFSHVLSNIKISNLIGIVEDTENGHQKYEAVLLKQNKGSFPCPIISVARSVLKEPEDFLVGQAIVFSAEAILREERQILAGKKALVLGYGKIGRSIAQHLQSKSVRVDVLDTNSNRQVLALAHSHHTAPKNIALKNADLIFCATGNHSLRKEDLNYIKKNALVFTATSADDEIENYSSLIKNAIPHGSHSKITQIGDQSNHFFLCNNGNAVNFMHGGIVGPFIYLVQAELLFALSQFSVAKKSSIFQLTDESKKFIAQLWLHYFSPQ